MQKLFIKFGGFVKEEASNRNRREFCCITAASFGGITADITLAKTLKPSPVPELDLFEAKTFKSTGGVILPYRLFVPKNYNAKRSYPLVLWLHGFGGRDTDNLMQMSYNNGFGAAAWVKAGDPGAESLHCRRAARPRLVEPSVAGGGL